MYLIPRFQPMEVRRFFVYLSLLTLIVAGPIGCSTKLGRRLANFGSKRQEQAALVQEEAPVDLEVAPATRDEDGKLRIRAYVRARTALETKSLAVSAQGLREGEVVEKLVRSISEVFPHDVMRKGQSALVQFELSADDLSEYQVVCSWGEEGVFLLGQPGGTQSSSPKEIAKVDSTPLTSSSIEKLQGLELNNLQLQGRPDPCAKPPDCDIWFTFEGMLGNKSSEPIREIELALGLFWVPDGSDFAFPANFDPLGDNEEAIRLESLTLGVGREKKLKISLDEAVPQVPGGQFVPRLRILNYRSLSSSVRGG